MKVKCGRKVYVNREKISRMSFCTIRVRVVVVCIYC
jgi:hypothetical protein